MDLNSIARVLEKSNYTVVLSGTDMIRENGYDPLKEGDSAYEIEQEYDYSAEEIFSSSFFATKKDVFYKFFKHWVLEQMNIEPGPGFQALARMEEMGKIANIITRRVFALPTRAGCKNVIELHRNVLNYCCPHCKKRFGIDEIRGYKNMPLCDNCMTPIRPDVVLFGERVDIKLISQAADEVEKADTLVVLGANLNSPLVNYLLPYYNGDHLILIHENENFADKEADGVYYGRVDEALPEIVRIMEGK